MSQSDFRDFRKFRHLCTFVPRQCKSICKQTQNVLFGKSRKSFGFCCVFALKTAIKVD